VGVKEQELFPRGLAWFSCGAASAMAAWLALAQYGHLLVEVIYCDTFKYEHPDNKRFFEDVEKWLGIKIKVLKSTEYEDVRDVWTKTGWLIGQKGARCTAEMKKAVRRDYERPGDIQVFGFTVEEGDRIKRFHEEQPEINGDFILFRNGVTKADCLKAIKTAGIEIPMMYKMGYRNNNCIGCVKGGAGYWNKIRRDFPESFQYMANLERSLGAIDEDGKRKGVAINKRYEGEERVRVFLDELPPDAGRYEAEPDIECGVLCQAG